MLYDTLCNPYGNHRENIYKEDACKKMRKESKYTTTKKKKKNQQNTNEGSKRGEEKQSN